MPGSLKIYLRRSGQLLSVFVVLAMVAMLVVNGINIASRTLGLGSVFWVHEFSIILALCVYFLSYGLIIRSQSELRIEFLSKRVPEPARSVLRFVSDLVQLGLYILMGYLAFQYARRVSVLDLPMTGVSEAWTFTPIVFGFLDSAIVIVVRFVAGGPSPPVQSAPPAEV